MKTTRKQQIRARDGNTGQLPRRLPTNQLQSRQIYQQHIQQITPVDPSSSSTNWATHEAHRTRGFNQDDLKTYTIRNTDKLQASMFDRFVLKEDVNLFPKRKSLGKLIANRYGRPKDTAFHLKQGFRHIIDGQTSKDPQEANLKKPL